MPPRPLILRRPHTDYTTYRIHLIDDAFPSTAVTFGPLKNDSYNFRERTD